jgi:hypothetical protein
MSHFYATIPTSTRKTTPTAQGSGHTGITTQAASWKGCIQTRLYEYKGQDWFEVSMIPWKNVHDDDAEPVGDSIILASGHVGDMNSVVCPLNAPSKR